MRRSPRDTPPPSPCAAEGSWSRCRRPTPRPPRTSTAARPGPRVTSSTSQTIRYEVTAGALPAGLVLNNDTGGITGVPSEEGASRFTITARNGGSVPDASITYELTVTPAIP
ncbi:Ig domain-containing protein [Streptomyces sp. NBC_00873]|uniref:Ig domain-containing protein n=1 Tax=unclassified Streptomyces TaxID=2593676 RepID=UPI00386E9FB9|nr:Ig domain-containing protein [Streptomyces sp. NBC_00873]WTA48998.1 Ig domain-containing protein [Streptomyces sp. NBC_00842]